MISNKNAEELKISVTRFCFKTTLNAAVTVSELDLATQRASSKSSACLWVSEMGLLKAEVTFNLRKPVGLGTGGLNTTKGQSVCLPCRALPSSPGSSWASAAWAPAYLLLRAGGPGPGGQHSQSLRSQLTGTPESYQRSSKYLRTVI